MIHINVPNFSL